MKRCSWCGKEYPDTAQKCVVDAQPLSGGEESLLTRANDPDPLPALVPASPRFTTSFAEIAAWGPTERQLRIFEIGLVCVVAFGGSVFHSLQYLIGLNPPVSSIGGRSWVYSGIHELSALALLWYVLLRRSRSISQLGFSWTKKDLGHSVLIWISATAAFGLVYGGIHAAGLTSTTYAAASSRVGRILFAGGVTATTIVFQFINPFFEELIVRAYLMTEVRELSNSVSKAVILSTLLQMSYHFYQGVPMAFAQGGVFLVCSLYYARTNRITPVILSHLYMDVLPTVAFMLRPG